MPRKALKVDVTLTIHAVSCPGVWLLSNNETYISVNLFGRCLRTQLADPVFPLVFEERFNLEKIFYTAVDPSEVSALLEIEPILFELIQLSDTDPSGAKLLASHENNARDFLYPYPQLSPIYGCTDRDILMDRAPNFPGISPKLEFSTNVVIIETRVPRRPIRLGVKAEVDKLVNDIPGRRTSEPRARSPSPTQLQVTDLSLDESQSPERPNFLVRKVEDSLILRRPGSPTIHRHTQSKGKKNVKSPSSGRSSGHRLQRLCEKTRPTSVNHHKAAKRESNNVSSSGLSTDFSDDSEVEYLGFTREHSTGRRSRTFSLPPYCPRRPISPIMLQRSLRDRYSDYLSGTIDRKWDEKIRRVSPRPYSPSYYTVSALRRRLLASGSRDSLDDLQRDFELAKIQGY